MRSIAHFSVRICAGAAQILRIQIPLRDLYSCTGAEPVDILFLEKDGYVVELVSPNAPDSVVSGLIKTYKNAPYHLCYVCENLDEEITKLTGEGYVQIDLPTPAPAIGGKRVCFLMNRFVGLIELLEQ